LRSGGNVAPNKDKGVALKPFYVSASLPSHHIVNNNDNDENNF
jgi:hypothetical protein